MHPTIKKSAVAIIAASLLGLTVAACNKPAYQSNAQSGAATQAAPAASAPILPPADSAAAAAAREPLKDMVTAALSAEPGLGAIEVDVNAQNGTVTLSGTTSNEENRTKASQIALNVPGVKAVQNFLVIKEFT